MTDEDNANILENTPGTFGATVLSIIQTEKRPIRILFLGGVIPGPETLRNGSYPFSKPFFIVSGNTVTPGAQQFIDFVFSRKVLSLLEDSGHVVIPR